MGQFDSLEIRQPDWGDTVATLARADGQPIEQQRFTSSGPAVSSEEEIVHVGSGFGIDSSGDLYFDTGGASEGEECVVRVIPSSMTLIFDTEG